MQQALPWIIALAVLVVIAAAMAFWVTRPRQAATIPLPTDWTVGPRAVFSVDERRAYRQLRDAFPHYIVLAKLPLIRFCQPAEPKEMHYWYELLGGIHVSFAVCSAHGRVLATIDLDAERAPARRTQQIKQSVLAACRVRYLRCTIDHLPSHAELQTLLPQGNSATGPAVGAGAAGADFGRLAGESGTARSPSPSPRGDTVPAALAGDAAAPVVRRTPASPVSAPAASSGRHADSHQRKERKALWQDSGLFQDSFFGIDNLRDAGPQSTLGLLMKDGRSAAPGQGDAGMLESELLKSRQKPS